MKSVAGVLAQRSRPAPDPSHGAERRRDRTSTIAIGKPTASASSERRASARRRWTRATQSPASGPNSGPTTIAPMIRMTRVGEDPDGGDQRREHHEDEEASRELGALGGAASTSSQMTASAGEPAPRPARPASGGRDRGVDRLDRDRALLIDAESRRPARTTLASSRAMSQRTRSPSGLIDAPGTLTTLITARARPAPRAPAGPCPSERSGGDGRFPLRRRRPRSDPRGRSCRPEEPQGGEAGGAGSAGFSFTEERKRVRPLAPGVPRAGRA